jgi:hypothetical protein
MIERISFDVLDILTGDDRAVILGSLESKLKRTGKDHQDGLRDRAHRRQW